MAGRIAYPLDPRSEVVEFVPDRVGSLLDVGCAAGAFGRTLRQRRPEIQAWAVEPDPVAASAARENYEKILAGPFPDVLASPAESRTRFDCIVFNDVLEHMVDPWAALVAARDHLNTRGVVVASIPNMRYWPVLRELVFGSEWRYADMGVLDRTHLRWFTKLSAHRTFVECGYRVESVTPINVLPSRKLRSIERVGGRYAGDIRSRQFVVVASVADRLAQNRPR